jgi:hypothetical protein
VRWTKGTTSVSLPITVAGGDADDLATTTVSIKGLASGATITDNLDGKTFSASTVTLTAAEVNSGLTLHPGRLASGTLTSMEFARLIEQPVDFACHDEIVFVQPLDLLCHERHRRVTPAETDVRVMVLALGQLADSVYESQRFPKIGKSEGPLDLMAICAQLPVRRLRLITLRLVGT